MMFSEQIRKDIKECWPVILPLGVLEYHAEHCVVGVDTLLVIKAVELLEKEMDLIILPPFYYGAASYVVESPKNKGTIQVRSDALNDFAGDLFKSLLRIGFRNIHLFIHHQSENFAAGMNVKNKWIFNPRIIRSPWSDYYGAEIENAGRAYPESYLKEIAEQGYNGIWLRVLLREIVNCRSFPEFGSKSEKQLLALNNLVVKAGRFGIKVWLYLCEPRGFKDKDPFWEDHPEVKGQPTTFQHTGSENDDGLYFALCSSTAKVKVFLEESSFRLFQRVPGLGGVFLITASEHHTHCYSHFPGYQKRFSDDPNREEWSKQGFVCPQCAKHQPAKVAAEIISLINQGIKKAAPEAEVIAWTWSWSILEPDPQKELISLLPKDIILMSDWERGGQKQVCGRRYTIDEYSFSYPGPSPRFQRQLELAKKKKMRVLAKIQISTTHELASVPYLPLPYLLASKMHRLKKFQVDGFLGCWIFGGDISPLSKLAGRMSQAPEIMPAQAVKELAKTEFGEKSAGAVLSAWKYFSIAWQYYPFSIPFLYYGPINYATAYPLSLNASEITPIASWRPLPRDKKGRILVGDNLKAWIKPFGTQTIISAFKRLIKDWEKGRMILQKALKEDRKNQKLKEELNLAEHISLSMASTINIIQFYHYLHQWRQAKKEERKKASALSLKKILEAELEIVKQDKKLIKADKRLGWHAEAQTYLFNLNDLNYKISLLRSQLGKISLPTVGSK